MDNQVVVVDIRTLYTIVEQASMRGAEMALKHLLPGKPRPHHVTQKQAAEMLDLSEPTISRMVKSGQLKLNKFGRIPINQIDHALETRQ
jgi:excisionase family DNA binding protein